MKNLVKIILIMGASSAFGFGVNLEERGKMKVTDLVKMNAEYVSCEQGLPRCILNGSGVGIQYPGQKIEEVSLTELSTAVRAIDKLQELKRHGLCN